MDVLHGHHYEYIGGALTLAISLWVAFGPLRHRLPRFLTRFAKLSAVLKLSATAIICGYVGVQTIRHHGSAAVAWAALTMCVLLIIGAVYVVRWKSLDASK